MSSTNKTSHYNLSQYIGTDKPTYLVDYNGDMSAIDSGIYAAKSEADTNATSIGTLSGLTTEAKSDLVGAINEVDGHADTNAGNISTNTTNIATNTSHIGIMTNLNTTEKSNLVGVANELKANIDNFNLTSFTSLTTDNMSATVGTLTGSVTIAKNSDGSLAKIYGRIGLTNIDGQSATKITITGTGLAPSSDFTINNAGMVRVGYGGGSEYLSFGFDILVKTTGVIEIEMNLYSYASLNFDLLPMLYFIKDFGDAPIPQPQ